MTPEKRRRGRQIRKTRRMWRRAAKALSQATVSMQAFVDAVNHLGASAMTATVDIDHLDLIPKENP